MRQLSLIFLPFLCIGCLGDGGGEAYDSTPFGPEQGRGFVNGAGREDGSAAPNFDGDSAADRPADEQANTCHGKSAEELEAMDRLGPYCRMCVCSTPPEDASDCSTDCSGA